jgi:formylglycine-generating enzyme required for sulfatase activity
MVEQSDGGLGAEVAFETAVVGEDGSIVARPIARARVLVDDLGGGVALEMVVVPGGRFLMGSPDGEGYDDERPRHEVSVEPFLIGRYLVAQAEWEKLMGLPPSRFRDDRLPVDGVSWRLAREFCRRLSAATGRAYRLPSEAEWEYACRAGSTGPFCCGETLATDLANYNGAFVFGRGAKGVYRHTTTAVKSLPPNAFGLCDVHGNLWEWCADAWHDGYDGAPSDGTPWDTDPDPPKADWGVLRGGSWHDEPASCRSAVRLRYRRSEGDELVGFRVAASLRR